MSRSASYAILAACAATVAGTALLMFSYAFRRGESYAEGSSYRATADGLRALALLWEAQGHSVTRLTDPWALKEKRGLLVTSGAAIKADELRSWVNGGNTVLFLCAGPSEHIEALGLKLESSTGDTMPAVEGAPHTEGAPHLGLQAGFRWDLEDASDTVSALYASGDSAGVVQVEAGSGKFVLLSDRHPVTNLGLPEQDNAVFLVNLATVARGREIVFDEISTRLALNEPGLMAYARKTGVQALFLEAGILALLALWHFGARTGPPVTRRPRAPPAVPDYVTGRSRLYEKAAMERTAIGALAETLREALRRASRLGPPSAQEGQALLARAESLKKARSRKTHELVGLARSIHDFMNEVIWKPARRPPRSTRIESLKRK